MPGTQVMGKQIKEDIAAFKELKLVKETVI